MRSHAVVIGGSMAGLLAARVLSDHFERVTLVERDRLPPEPGDRRGVPQARHAHVLLVRGLQILSDLFPDLPGALAEAGGVEADIGSSARWHLYGGYKVRFHAGIGGHLVGRPLLEWLVRTRTLARPNVSHLDGTAARGLVATPDRSRVVGVEVQSPDEGGARVLPADLVVDATGRGSRTPGWLDALGYGRPPVSEVTVDLGYASRVYRRSPGDLPGDARLALALPTPPRETRSGALLPMEGDRWMLTLVGLLGDHPPLDDAGFLEFARSLPAPDIYRIARRATPLGPAVPHRLPSSLRRHYERMSSFPEGLLVMGDAMCSFNPIYGQGMTVSALEARALHEELSAGRGGPRGLPRRFHRRAAAIVDLAWNAAVGEDARYPQVRGPKPRGTALINWYTERVHRASLHDPEVCFAFAQVMHMLRSPAILFRPRILVRAIRAASRPPPPDPWAAQSDGGREVPAVVR